MPEPDDRVHPRAPQRSAAHRATVSLNDLLIGVYEQLLAARLLEALPASLRSAVDHLTDEVAKLQGVTEWVTEDLVRLVEDDASSE